MITIRIDEIKCSYKKRYVESALILKKVDEENMQKELREEIEEKQPTPTALLCGSTNQGARNTL